jgi:hypothetical protein
MKNKNAEELKCVSHYFNFHLTVQGQYEAVFSTSHPRHTCFFHPCGWCLQARDWGIHPEHLWKRLFYDV